ncbi:MAG TPA: PQQ-dependent sugar dehydrogenase [Gemmatimonadales bacterium]|nr:PQQ-dependent sugar dehydrogenase [Gemmatimonadales bacterium]
MSLALPRAARTGLALACLALPLSAQARSSATAVPHPARELGVFETERARLRVEIVADSLQIPWGLAFLPDGRALLTERPIGRMSLLDLATGALTPIEGVPPVFGEGDGGLLDVAVHPDYARTGWIYFSYATRTPEGNTTAVDRAKLRGSRLVGRQRLFAAVPAIANANHFGCRLVLHAGYLFISLGDRDERDRAQRLDTHHGKIVRLHDDGRAPNDNPFAGRPGALPEIWSYGHRNPQGLTWRAEDGTLWEHEHGPRGGDEVNILRRGANYGWPVITYGREYEGGPVGEGLTRGDGMEQPVHYFIPSIAPSGMEFYTGDLVPKWKGNLFIGAMGLTHLNRLVVRGDTVIAEERLFDGMRWRVRLVRQGPDGFLYIGTDTGQILRLRPVEEG